MAHYKRPNMPGNPNDYASWATDDFSDVGQRLVDQKPGSCLSQLPKEEAERKIWKRILGDYGYSDIVGKATTSGRVTRFVTVEGTLAAEPAYRTGRDIILKASIALNVRNKLLKQHDHSIRTRPQ